MPGHVEGKQVTMAALALGLSRQLDRPVVDATGIRGTSDVALDFSRDTLSSTSGETEPQPPIFTVLKKELGLQLVPKTAPIDVVVVYRADKVPIPD